MIKIFYKIYCEMNDQDLLKVNDQHLLKMNGDQHLLKVNDKDFS